MGDPTPKPAVPDKPKRVDPAPPAAKPSSTAASAPGGNALLVEQIRIARDALQSLVLNDQGRADEQTTLDAELAQLDASGVEATLAPDQRAIVDSARAELLRERGGMLGGWTRSPDLAPPPQQPVATLDLPSRKELLAKLSPLARLSIEQLDDGATGKVLIAEAVSNRSIADMTRWAYELQSVPQSDYGNYLRKWYYVLYDDYPDLALKLGQKLADQGIEFGADADGFTHLEHIDPKEPLPATMAADVEKQPLSKLVDNYSQVAYDLAYRRVGGALSEYLQLTYPDGARLDLDLRLISDNAEPASFHAIAYSYVGAAGRVFPLRLDPQTTPRLWKAKQWAIQIMQGSNEDFEFFVSLSLAGVMSNLPMGPVIMEEPVDVVPGGRPTRPVVPAGPKVVVEEATALTVDNVESVIATLRSRRVVSDEEVALLRAAAATKGEKWNLGPALRGEVSHALSGENLPPTFKTIDRVNGVDAEGNALEVTSIKSHQPYSESMKEPGGFENTLKREVDDVAKFKRGQVGKQIVRTGPDTKRVLEVEVPPDTLSPEVPGRPPGDPELRAQWRTEAANAEKYAASQNVKIRFKAATK
ncbi:MAG: hypothetical protein ACM31C_31295 [Acidobacteriota bacterium]